MSVLVAYAQLQPWRGTVRDHLYSFRRYGTRSYEYVNLVWLAGLVFVIGALVTMWPDAREARRLALRYEGEGAAGVRA